MKRRRTLGDLTKVDEYGVSFETGKPVTLRFIRNTERSPNFGARFQQDIEPAGRYFTHAPPGNHEPPRGWERGEVSFKNPLVLEFNEGDGHYDERSWKAWLQRKFRKKGRALTCALKKAGHDGIVTVGVDRARRPIDTLEIVDLRVVDCAKRRR